jgi:predicted NUDIX family NTP pyrophosphohydrolase
MPMLALFRWQGDADPLVAAYDREMTDAPAVTLDQPRRKLHVFAHGESRAVVVDLWESEDDFRRMFDAAEFKRNVAASNWPGRPEVEVYQVHATVL